MAASESIQTVTMNVTDARQHFSEVLTKVFRGQSRVVVEKSGIPVAAIISTADLERLRRYDEQRVERFRALAETSRAFNDVPLEELEEQVAKALASVRARKRDERQRSDLSA